MRGHFSINLFILIFDVQKWIRCLVILFRINVLFCSKLNINFIVLVRNTQLTVVNRPQG